MDEIFFDDFNNTSNWINFGRPLPYTRGGKYFVNGDANYPSGSYSKQRFRIKDGLVLEFKACQSPGNVWDMFYHVGFGKNYHYSDRHVPYTITFGIYGHNPDKNMRYNNAVVCRVGSNRKILAGLNDGHSHTYKIEFENGNVLFYRDDELLYQCHNPYIGQELPLLIAGRSYHGSNWIEYIKVYHKERESTIKSTINNIRINEVPKSTNYTNTYYYVALAIIAVIGIVYIYKKYKK